MNLQEVKQLPRKKPIQSVPTRWNSTLHMLQCILENKPAVVVFLNTRTDLQKINEEDWRLISGLIKILEPLEKVIIKHFAK